MRAVVLGAIGMAAALIGGSVARDVNLWRAPAQQEDGRAGYLIMISEPGNPAGQPALAWPLDSFAGCERIAALQRRLYAEQGAAGKPAIGATFCIPFAPPRSDHEEGRRHDRP